MAKKRQKEDLPKATLSIPLMITSWAYLSPYQRGKYKKHWITVVAIICIFLIWGQVNFIQEHYEYPEELIGALSTIPTNIQALYKAMVMYCFQKTLTNVIDTIRKDFLNSGKQFARFSKIVVIYMWYQYTVGLVYAAFMCINSLLSSGTRELPVTSEYPINWRDSPTFEIVGITQTVLYFMIVIPSILGCDYFFITLCFNTICQYQLLGDIMKNFGDPTFTDKYVETYLRQNNNTNAKYKDNTNREFLVFCMRHHLLILNVTKKLEKIFNVLNLMQLVISLSTICFGIFLLTNSTQLNMYKIVFIMMYTAGYTIELFSACYFGNEITFRAGKLADYLYNSKWYEIYDLELRRDMALFLRMLAYVPKITAFKVFIMDYQTCIQVYKLSFSFYTYLSYMNEKSIQK